MQSPVLVLVLEVLKVALKVLPARAAAQVQKAAILQEITSHLRQRVGVVVAILEAAVVPEVAATHIAVIDQAVAFSSSHPFGAVVDTMAGDISLHYR